MVVKWLISLVQVLPLPRKREEPGCEGSLLSCPVLCLPMFMLLAVVTQGFVERAAGLAGMHKGPVPEQHADHRESERERERRCTDTIHCPCCGYTSVVGQPPSGERNTCFEKFNVIFSRPSYLKNNILAMVGSQVVGMLCFVYEHTGSCLE